MPSRNLFRSKLFVAGAGVAVAPRAACSERGNLARLSGGCAFFSLLLAASLPASSADGAKVTRICLAPPSTQIPGMNNDEALASVREVFTKYLTGPTVGVEPLEARLTSQTREEAKQKQCAYVLYTKVVQERKTRSSGFLGRVAAGAIQGGASQVAGSTSSVGTRVIASAAAGGASSGYYGSWTQTSDKLTLTARLESGQGRVLTDKSATRKADSDGEDLLTPLVEQASEQVMSAMKK
jgi:hypothetical protein